LRIGKNENAKSGVAINARQRQGDRATYNFIDNQAIAIRRTGKILIDLIPKIYDTPRVIRIEAKDGSIMNVTMDPNADQAFQKQPDPNGQPDMDNQQQIVNIIFNPIYQSSFFLCRTTGTFISVYNSYRLPDIQFRLFLFFC